MFPVDEKYIKAAEEELKVRFPDSYRSAMMNMNGGIALCPNSEAFDAWELFPFYDTSDKKRIKRTFNSVVRETQLAWRDYGLPQNMIAIGTDGGGNYLVFLIDENNKINSSVYVAYDDYSKVEKIADDFSNMRHKKY